MSKKPVHFVDMRLEKAKKEEEDKKIEIHSIEETKKEIQETMRVLTEEISRKKLDEEIKGLIDKKEIEEAFGYTLPRACGYWITLKIVDPLEVAVRSDGTKSNILLSDASIESDGYKQSTGFVVSIGPDFYRNKYNFLIRFIKWMSKFMGSYIHNKIGRYDINVGEYYAINRYSGKQFDYKGVKFINVNYEVPQSQIEDPHSFRKF